MDSFITMFHRYRKLLPDFEAQQRVSSIWSFPAYHQWFAAQLPVDLSIFLDDVRVLDEASLREIGREHPYVFWVAKLSMDYIQETRP